METENPFDEIMKAKVFTTPAADKYIKRTINFEKDTYIKARQIAVAEGTNIGLLMRQALASYVRNYREGLI